MTPSEFARRYGRIQHLARINPQRAAKCRKALVKRARARPEVLRSTAVAYRMPTGIACVRFRYRAEAAARAELARISEYSKRLRQPNRAYPCVLCKAWHLAVETWSDEHARPHDGA